MNSLFIASLIISIVYMILFWGKHVGLSLIVFMVPLTFYIINILKKNEKIKNEKAKWLIIPILLLSSTYFIFNNSFFYIVNIPIIIILLSIMILFLIGENLKINTFFSKILNIIFEPLCYIGETWKLCKISIKEKFNIKTNTDKKQKVGKVLKGLLYSLPLVILIIILLSSADDEFKNLFVNIFKNIINIIKKIKITTAIWKIFVTFIIFIYTSCFLNNLVNKYKVEEIKQIQDCNKEYKDNTTIKILLGLLNIVYLLFCYLQIKSLILNNTNIVFSSYARRGFFQLMIVSIINIITIIYAKENIKSKDNKNDYKYIKIMSLIMIVFTIIILISSIIRMYSYENAYGYTILRLLVSFAQLAEGIILIPTILYVLDKKINLIKSYFLTVLIVYICMNFICLDNIIAKKNIDRYFETGKIDTYYLFSSISEDGTSQILRLLGDEQVKNEEYENSQEIKKKTRDYLKTIDQKLKEEKFDLREFNISKLLAKHLIKIEMDKYI